VAPTLEELKASLETVATSPVVVERIAGLPFPVAITTAGISGSSGGSNVLLDPL
jgi:hypothetical protein